MDKKLVASELIRIAKKISAMTVEEQYVQYHGKKLQETMERVVNFLNNQFDEAKKGLDSSFDEIQYPLWDIHDWTVGLEMNKWKDYPENYKKFQQEYDRIVDNDFKKVIDLKEQFKKQSSQMIENISKKLNQNTKNFIDSLHERKPHNS